jgi:hypothetical protein
LFGNWDISSLTDAIGMFDDSKMSIANMDNTLRGWAKLDTATGETAIQNNVTWDIKNYTDATARQYLKGTCATKHRMHIGDLTNIPITNVLVKSFCVSEHPRHINYLANIPTHRRNRYSEQCYLGYQKLHRCHCQTIFNRHLWLDY